MKEKLVKISKKRALQNSFLSAQVHQAPLLKPNEKQKKDIEANGWFYSPRALQKKSASLDPWIVINKSKQAATLEEKEDAYVNLYHKLNYWTFGNGAKTGCGERLEKYFKDKAGKVQ